MLKTFSIAGSFCILLTGCASSVDLRTSERLSEQDRKLAVSISNLVQSRCTHHQYYPGSDQKTTGDNKFSQSPSIKRMYKSTSGWIKVEMQADGVWDSTYFHQGTGSLICGERTWQRYKDSNTVTFTEVDAFERTLPNSANPSTAQPIGLKRAVNIFSRPIAVQWENYPRLISGLVTVSEAGKKGVISANLPAGEGQCTGVYEAIDLRRGNWAVSCTNGLAATGSMELHGAGKGSTGVGFDSKGNKVSFTVAGEIP